MYLPILGQEMAQDLMEMSFDSVLLENELVKEMIQVEDDKKLAW